MFRSRSRSWTIGGVCVHVREVGSSWKKAFLTGVALAAVPILGLNILLAVNMVGSAQREVDGVATEVLSIVEARLDDAATALIGLGMNRVSGCAEADRSALQKAAARSGAGADVSIVDASGGGTCASSGLVRVVRRMSPEHGTLTSDVVLSTAAYGESGARRLLQLTLRKDGGQSAYRVLIPSDQIVPFILKSRLTASFMMQLVMVDGAVVLRKYLDPSQRDVNESELPSVTAAAVSERYPMRIDVEAPGWALIAANAGLFLYANIGGLLFGFLVVTISILFTRRGGGPVREIADGIRRGEFIPYYQPVIDIVTGRLAGCEVLVRWRKPDGTVLPPGRFISLAEASGEIFPMTLAVMEIARDELSEVYSKHPHLELGFNLFAGHFDDTLIVDDVKRIFGGSRIAMDQLMFEVTERQPLSDITLARLVIAKLQAMGARVALDDVGTGHGGLTYLLKLGVDVMKMDKMFVDAIGTDRYSVAIVDSLVKLANDMSLELIAEGVETFEQLQYLRDKGVRMAQGYVFAPPLPASSFLKLAVAMNPASAAPAAHGANDYTGPVRLAGVA